MQKDKNIIAISIFNSTFKFVQQAMLFFFGIYLKQIGFTGFEIGLAVAVGTITRLIVIIPSGFLNDRIKSRHLLSVGIFLIALAYFLMAIFTSLPLILLAFLFGGLGYSLYTTSMESIFYKSTQKETAHENIGIYQSINYFMIGLGMALAGYLLNINLPFKEIFSAIAIIFIILALSAQILLPKTISAKFEIFRYKKDMFKKNILYLLIMAFLFAIHFGSEETTYGLFLRTNLHLTDFQAGLYMGSNIFTMGLTAFLIRKHFKKIKAKNLLLIGTFFSGTGHILMTLNPLWLSWIFRFMHETGDAFMFFFMFYSISQFFEAERVGGNNGIITFVSTIGGSLGALLFGYLGGKYGYNVPFVVSGITTLLAFVLALKFHPLKQHEHAYSPDRA